MSERYFDFDSFIAEAEGEPVTIKVFGKVEELPPSPPADLTLKVIRLQKQGVQNVEAQYLHDLAYGLFGEKRLNAWLKKGLTMQGLQALIQKTMELYQKPQDEENKKKVENASTPS